MPTEQLLKALRDIVEDAELQSSMRGRSLYYKVNTELIDDARELIAEINLTDPA